MRGPVRAALFEVGKLTQLDNMTTQATWTLFTYNLLVALYLGYFRVSGGFVGYLLLPAIAVHASITLLL
jgi:hypothetical protein